MQIVPPGHCRTAPVAHLAALLDTLGVEGTGLIRGLGLDPAILLQQEGVMAYHDIARIFAAGIRATATPHLGLLIGEPVGLEQFGLMGAVARQGQTVRQAMTDLVELMHVFDRGGLASQRIEDDHYIVSYSVLAADNPAIAAICDTCLVIIHNLMRDLCGGIRAPLQVRLHRHKPADPSPYRRMFRAPLRFEAEENALVFPTALLDQPVSGADPVVRQTLMDHATTAGQIALSEQIRRRLRAALPQRWLDEPVIAGQLGVGQSTLRRHLAAEGTSLREIAAGVRYEMAKYLMRETPMTLSEIAASLGYSEQSAFTRAFRTWSSLAPQEWRQQQDADSLTER